MWDLPSLQHGTHAFDRAKRAKKCGANRGSQLHVKLLRNGASQRVVVVEDRRRASSEEQIKRLIQTEADAVSRQHFRKTAATQHLAIDQHAVAIENDEIGLHHCKFPNPDQSIYSWIGQ